MADSGVRAEVRVTGSSVCRAVDASEAGDVVSVSRAACPASDETTIEFTADSGLEEVDAKEVFAYNGKAVYRFERPAESELYCACDVIECSGYPVRHNDVDTGSVVLSFIADDIKSLRDIVETLEDRFDGVSLQCLTRSAGVDGERDLVFVDRAALTDRQREVLETAHEMGYFSHPKEANAGEVADALGISRSTFAEHIAAAQTKLLDAVLEV